jgi:UPF0755 protein
MSGPGRPDGPEPDDTDARPRPPAGVVLDLDAPRATTPPTVPPRTARREQQRRRRLVALLVVGAVALVVVLGAAWFAHQLFMPFSAGGEPVTVEVKEGWGAQQTGAALDAQGVIGSELAFRVWARVSGASFQAGSYTFDENMGVVDALDVLEAGPDGAAAGQLRLLLPPGLTLGKIADRVGQLPGHDRDTFLQVASSGVVRSKYQPEGVTSLEGLTWPDTYFVSDTQTDQQILEMIVGEFDERADALRLAVPTASGLTPYEAIVSASLIQGEAGRPDQPTVSGVIGNRLRRGMPLQIDATLCYAKGGCPPVPSNADKQIDSPYNTYRVNGLPPTPILTVTESALRAALAPASHAYLYYVTGDDGVTRFAETFEGHEENIREFGVSGE